MKRIRFHMENKRLVGEIQTMDLEMKIASGSVWGGVRGYHHVGFLVGGILLCRYLWVYVRRMSLCPYVWVYLWVYVRRMSLCPYVWAYVRV